jgi:hypothetical protein
MSLSGYVRDLGVVYRLPSIETASGAAQSDCLHLITVVVWTYFSPYSGSEL